MQQVDFKKYADIIVNLQMNNEHYRLIKLFDEKTLDKIRYQFDKDSGTKMLDTVNRLCNKAAESQKRVFHHKVKKPSCSQKNGGAWLRNLPAET